MAATDLSIDFAGRRGRLFWLALKTSVLTVLTLGFYRFWMKTRLRRYYWSAIRPGGVPLEYVGLPLEKLLGFLIAVVFLAFYIGIVNLILMFLSFSLFQGNFAAYALSFVGVIPILFYARYRARRYVLARTRWRGLRFGLEPGAWGYAWRALVHWLVTILSLGLLWPRMTFWLEKYRTDRTFFGSTRLQQGGRWTMLYPALAHLLIGILLSAASIGLGVEVSEQALWALGLGLPWTLYGLVHYRVQSFRHLTNHKTADGIGFCARPRPRRVLRIYLVGGTIIFLFQMILLFAVFAAFTVAVSFYVDDGFVFDDFPFLMQVLPGWLATAMAVAFYFMFFVFWGVLTHIFLTMPLIRHYAETLHLTGAPQLALVSQRARDESAEAEGFAEALDVGAAL